ncbi:MAG: radical SAM protein, partial [Deltaproteobacteria bacterium]|nr:radical SAM protein [Deltaproteobacteria bacterium]
MSMHRKINAAKVLLCYLSRIELTINPILIELELTNVCNRRCVMCPNDRMTRASGFMDWTLFTDIVNQTIDTALEYSFDFQGEPTLHPRFLEMVNYVKQRGGRIALYTNMNFHDENLNDELVNSGIDKIVVSLHGTGDESYRIISP